MNFFKQIKTQGNNYYMCFKCFWVTENKDSTKLHKCTKELLEQSKQYKTNLNGSLIININDIIKNYISNKEFNLNINS